MAIGMTFDQYWYGDTHMARAFYEAYKVRQKQLNEQAWLHGVYVSHAIEATICNAFRKRGSTPAEYPKKPIGNEDNEEELAEEREEQEAVYAEAYMTNMVMAGQNWGKLR